MAAVKKLNQRESRRYTYADYCEWDDDERWELIDGIPYAMAAPTRIHQGISGVCLKTVPTEARLIMVLLKCLSRCWKAARSTLQRFLGGEPTSDHLNVD